MYQEKIIKKILYWNTGIKVFKNPRNANTPGLTTLWWLEHPFKMLLNNEQKHS